MTTIENEFLKVSISSQGAQLSSLYNKAARVEHMWQADPQVWPWHAPNLFPIVGGLIDNQLVVKGQQYTLPRHGFARQSMFKLAESTATHADYALRYSDETLAVYPYRFIFYVMYDLIDNALRVTYKVINADSQPIYFSVGGHPAFNVPMGNQGTYENYYLEFETSEKLERHLLSAEGYLSGETAPVALQHNKLPLTHDLFKDDALVFKNIQSKQVTIKSDQHPHTLTVEYPNFKHLGVWAKPGADFVCIEPWLGYADTAGLPADIVHKQAIQKLEIGHVFEASYFISI